MPDPAAVPPSLGHYSIVSPLGAGGMGEVYLATDTRLNRKVAIKILPSGPGIDHDAQERMLREARLIATIDHPNVCTIYEIGQQGEQPYIVMQYVDGETLGERMMRGRLSLPEAVDLGRQITAALGEAHRRGIVHRDIKPANIMITSSGVVKVLDFGLAKTFQTTPDDATERVISTDNLIAGTMPYMSPEQLLGGPLDGRSDIFSLGVVLYEIATARRPFHRPTAAGTISAILTAEPQPLTESDLLELEPLILCALEKTASRRFADAAAMLEAFGAIVDRGPHVPARPAPATSRRAEPSTDPATTRLYLRGRTQWNKRHPQAIREAIALFNEAVETDPLHASSYAGLADSYMLLGFLQVIPPRDVIPKAKAAALRAIELAPELAEPHASLGYLAGMFEWDWATAQRELTEAMKLNPQYAWAPHWYGTLVAPKSLDDSLLYVTRAHSLDPLSPIIHTAVGLTLYWRGEYVDALRLYSQVLDTEAAFAPAHHYIGLTYEQMGDFESAIRNQMHAADIASRGGLFLGALGHCYGISGHQDLARTVLQELEQRSRERYVSPYDVMIVHVGLGDTERSLEWLERALEDRAAWLWFARIDPRFDTIRREPRFVELLAGYGL